MVKDSDGFILAMTAGNKMGDFSIGDGTENHESSRAGAPIELEVSAAVKELQNCMEGCRLATTTEQQESSWESLIQAINKLDKSEYHVKEKTIREVFMEFPYSSPAYSGHMDRVLDACGETMAVSTCCGLIKNMGSPASHERKMVSMNRNFPPSSILEACWSNLQRLLLTKRQGDTAATSFSETSSNNAELERLVKLILCIPSLMGNACHICKVRLPLLATSSKFYPRLVDCSWSQGYEDDAYRITVLKTLLANRNNAEPLALGLASHHPLSAATLVSPKVSWSSRELSNFLLALLQHCATMWDVDSDATKDVLATCQTLLESAPTESQEIVVHHVVLSNTVCDDRICPLFIRLLDGCGILQSSLGDVTEAWSQGSFCHETPTHQQHFISQMILLGLLYCPDLAPGNEEDSLTLHLLQGVTHRLESFRPEIRLDGMRIAKQVAQRMNQELHFDELAEWEEQEHIKAISSSEEDVPQAATTPTRCEQPKTYTNRKQKTKQLRDPDADYVSDDDGNDQTSSNAGSIQDDDSTVYDDELVPYSLEDDEEDLVETPSPIHLLHALELLRTPEDDEHAFSHQDTAMRTLPELIRKRPDDLPDAAISLLMQVLRMENKFGIEDFLHTRQASLVALTVEEPIQVGQQLIEEIFKDGTLSDRLACFGALQVAAYELSGSKDLDRKATGTALQDATSGKNKALVASTNSGELWSTSGDMDQVTRLETKTRRKRSRRPAPVLIRNKFTSIAPVWFYSLLGHFSREKASKMLWSGPTGSQLLASLIRTLAVIVEFAGITSAPVLAKDLMELVRGFIDADVAGVRMSALISVATSIAMLPEQCLLDSLLQQNDKLEHRIGSMSRLDPDDNCRQIASMITQSIVDALRTVRNPLIES